MALGQPSSVLDWATTTRLQQQQDAALSSPSSTMVTHFEKLVVPPSMRSIYWKYFGFPGTGDGQIITRMKIVCTICQQLIVYNRNTSNLRVHLQTHHPHELRDLEISSSLAGNLSRGVANNEAVVLPNPRVPPSGGTGRGYCLAGGGGGGASGGGLLGDQQFPQVIVKEEFRPQAQGEDSQGSSSGSSAKLAPSAWLRSDDGMLPDDGIEHDSDDLPSAMADFLIQDLLPLEILDGKGFRRLASLLTTPGRDVPVASRIEEDVLPPTYATVRINLQSYISAQMATGGKGGKDMALCLESWDSVADGSRRWFLTASVVYVGNEYQLQTRVLQTTACPPEWRMDNYKTFLQDMLEEWDLKSIGAAVVSSSNQILLQALEAMDVTIIPCLMYVLQTIAEVCFEKVDIKSALDNCRRVVSYMMENATSLGLGVNTKLFSDYPLVWTTTYSMVERLKENKGMVDKLLEDMASAEKDHLHLHSVNWGLLNDILMVFKPLVVATTTLGEERTPTASLIKPLLSQLEKVHLQPIEGESPMASSMKDTVSRLLREKYQGERLHLFLQTAAFLDPRFKDVSRDKEQEKQRVMTYLTQSLAGLVPPEEESGGPPPKKPNMTSGMEFLLGDLVCAQQRPEASIQKKVEVELAQYVIEEVAGLDSCPVAWWAGMKSKCPYLTAMAARFLSLPLTATASVQADDAVLFHKRRSVLPLNIVDKMLFLHHNLRRPQYHKGT